MTAIKISDIARLADSTNEHAKRLWLYKRSKSKLEKEVIHLYEKTSLLADLCCLLSTKNQGDNASCIENVDSELTDRLEELINKPLPPKGATALVDYKEQNNE